MPRPCPRTQRVPIYDSKGKIKGWRTQVCPICNGSGIQR